MQILIKGARVLDPGKLDDKRDILVKDGVIEALLDPLAPLEKLDLSDSQVVGVQAEDVQVVDAKGMVVVPGLIDIHVHLREPGHEYKETIESGLKAAAKGGFTAVCCMPNTTPVNDNAQVTEFIINKGKQARAAKVYPAGTISQGSAGSSLSEMYDMQKAGIRAATDDGLPVEDSQMMRRSLEYCKGLDLPIFVHAEDKSLADGGSMNEGPHATFLGIKGIPNAAESIMVVRDIALCELTGAAVHFCHMSTKESIEAIRQAKKRGANVSCETAPHYFTLTDTAVIDYDPNFKMNPPLRSEQDRQAIIAGLVDGTIDMIASDHAPQSVDEKDVEFDQAAFGIVGLETSLPLSLKLVQDGFLSLNDLIDKISKKPARMLKIDNDIKPGNPADLTIIDPEIQYEIDPATFVSKCKNTPFTGIKVQGEAFLTMVDGRIVYQRVQK